MRHKTMAVVLSMVALGWQASAASDATDSEKNDSTEKQATELLAMAGTPSLYLSQPASKLKSQKLERIQEATSLAVAIPLVDAQPLAVDSVRTRLKHPDSARFRFVSLYLEHETNAPRPVVCGEVNAVNSLGEYVGYQRFISYGLPGDTLLELGTDRFDTEWRRHCDGNQSIDVQALSDKEWGDQPA